MNKRKIYETTAYLPTCGGPSIDENITEWAYQEYAKYPPHLLPKTLKQDAIMVDLEIIPQVGQHFGVFVKAKWVQK